MKKGHKRIDGLKSVVVTISISSTSKDLLDAGFPQLSVPKIELVVDDYLLLGDVTLSMISPKNLKINLGNKGFYLATAEISGKTDDQTIKLQITWLRRSQAENSQSLTIEQKRVVKKYLDLVYWELHWFCSKFAITFNFSEVMNPEQVQAITKAIQGVRMDTGGNGRRWQKG